MSIAYTCSHYGLTHSAVPGRPPRACVVFILLPGGLFIHLHTVAVDRITWPGGDGELLGTRPAALKVRRAARAGEVVSDESSISRSRFTVTPHRHKPVSTLCLSLNSDFIYPLCLHLNPSVLFTPHEHRFIECTPFSKVHIHTMMMISKSSLQGKIHD